MSKILPQSPSGPTLTSHRGPIEVLRRTGFLSACTGRLPLEEGKEGCWSSEAWVGGEACPRGRMGDQGSHPGSIQGASSLQINRRKSLGWWP